MKFLKSLIQNYLKKKKNKEFDGEEDKLKEFKELYEKGSIIKRLFYCPQEYNIFCIHHVGKRSINISIV